MSGAGSEPAGPKRAAYFVPPHAGGVYTKYRYLRRAAARHGWDVRCWAAGAPAAGHRDAAVAAASGEGDEVRVAPDEADPRRAARALADELARRGVRVVLPMLDPLAAALVPHLPAPVRAVNCCSEITPWGYRVATKNADRVSRFTATTPRQRDALLDRGLSEDRVSLIPLAVVDDLGGAAAPPPRPERAGPLRLAYVGRVEDRQKGALTLPAVTARLRALGVPHRLTVAGDGPDAADLAARFARAGGAGDVALLGRVTPDRVAALLAATDVLLFPSRNEGFGLAAVEAAAAGAVPVASRIPGVTDFTVRDGETGLLCAADDAGAFAAAVGALHRDRGRLAALSAAGARDARDRFGLAAFGAAYAGVFDAALAEPDGPGPDPWDDFRAPSVGRRRFTRWIPRRARRLVRGQLERLRGRAGG